MKIFRRKLKIIVTVFFILCALFVYSYFIEPNSFVIKKPSFELECLRGTALHIKFAHISDLHFTSKTPKERIRQIYNEIKKTDSSVVFITGDLISDKSGIVSTVKFVNNISKEYSVYVVFGNWDFWLLDYNIASFKKALEKAGAKVLVNDALSIKTGDKLIDVIGVKDPYSSSETEKDLKKAIDKIKSNKGVCRILLAHSPSIIKEALRENIDLILVGHTHGGQINIPFLAKEIIPVRKRENRKYVKGQYKVNGTQMYVNSGIGTSVFPIRFLTPPEVAEITLKPESF